MNLSSPLIKSTGCESQNTKLRWTIVAAGIAINTAILFPTIATTPDAIHSSQNSESVTYLPPAAIAPQPQPLANSSSQNSISDVQKQFALADALANAGDRDAAVEQYLRAMTAQVNAQANDRSR